MKAYIYIIVCAAAMAGLAGAFMYGIKYGESRIINASNQAVIEYQEREAELLADLEAAKRERVKVIEKKVEVIRHAKDNCLDTDMPNGLYRLYPGSNGGQAVTRTDG